MKKNILNFIPELINIFFKGDVDDKHEQNPTNVDILSGNITHSFLFFFYRYFYKNKIRYSDVILFLITVKMTKLLSSFHASVRSRVQYLIGF